MIKILGLQEQDIPRLCEIYVAARRAGEEKIIPQTYLDALTPETYIEKWQGWTNDNAQCLCAFEGDHLIGFTAFGNVHTRPAGDRGIVPTYSAEIFAIYVDPAHWGKGAGKLLLREAGKTLQEGRHNGIILWVLKDNERAVDFYLKYGGQKVGKQKVEIGGRTVIESAIAWRPLTKILD